MWFTTSSGRIELQITKAQARACSHPGDNEPAVLRLRQEPRIKRQLAKLDPVVVANELSDYGAWGEDELADHDMNLTRLLWLACHDIAEENT
jgi:hypothetical protein